MDEDLPPADMTFTLDEVDRMTVEQAERAHPADMNFSLDDVEHPAAPAAHLDEVHRASPAAEHAEHGEHGGGEGPEHESTAERVLHGIHLAHLGGDLVHLGMEGANLVQEGHEAAEAAHMVQQAAQQGITISQEMALANVAPEVSSLSSATSGVGLALAPIGALLGGVELGEGINENDGTRMVGGALSIAAGAAGTGASVAAATGASAPALATAAPVLGAAAAGYGTGRLIDTYGGQALGAMGSTHEVQQRGLHGGTTTEEDDRPLSQRMGDAAASTSIGHDVALAAAENLPVWMGGDLRNDQLVDHALHPYIPGVRDDPAHYAATDHLVHRVAGGARDAWNSVPGLFH